MTIRKSFFATLFGAFLSTTAFAQGGGSIYVISRNMVDGKFVARNGTMLVAQKDTVTELIEAIKQDVGQSLIGDLNDAAIQFGAVSFTPEGQGLYIGSQKIEFTNDRVINQWKVALSGEINSNGDAPAIKIASKIRINSESNVTIRLSGSMVTPGQIVVSNGADYKSAFTLANPGWVLEIDGNHLVATAVQPSSSSTVPSSSSSGGASSSSSDNTPIAYYPAPLPASHSQIYYTIKGEPAGSAKPKKPGVYLVKQGGTVRKVVVR